MSKSRVYWLHALSPTHAGIGRGVGYIDLPIDRDGVTGWPIIRGSGFKGVWADYYTRRESEKDRKKNDLLRAAFGIAGDDENSNAGALIPTDAKLACLPVRSFRGTFAWCTSSMCLRMLRRTLELAGIGDLPAAPPELADGDALHAEGTALIEGANIFLEDLDFAALQSPIANAWAEKIAAWVFPGDPAWQEQFRKRFVILSGVAFDFLCETGTEVSTRVRIDDDTKTVVPGALWSEESLPAETILAGVVLCDRIFGREGNEITPLGLLDHFANDSLTLQIGGKATIGRGQMRCMFTPLAGGGH
jgi:CRISPR-associated protein Cmr4